MNAVTRRDDYRPAGPHLLQRPFNLPLCLFNLSIAPHHCKKHTHHEKFLEGILRGSNGAPSGCRRRAAVHHACRGGHPQKVHGPLGGVHQRPVWVEHSIHIMELLLAEEKYKVVGFDLEYTRARAGSRPKVAVAQMCMCHHILVYH